MGIAVAGLLLAAWALLLHGAERGRGIPWWVGPAAGAWGMFAAAPLTHWCTGVVADWIGFTARSPARTAFVVLAAAPLLEELLKLAGAHAAFLRGVGAGAWTARNGFLAGAWSGLGFAAAEAAWSTFGAGAASPWALVERAVFVVPMHGLATGCGVALAAALRSGWGGRSVCAAAAVLIHLAWNAAIFSGSELAGTVARTGVLAGVAGAAIWLGRRRGA